MKKRTRRVAAAMVCGAGGVAVLVGGAGYLAKRIVPGKTEDGSIRLHNGWKITPAGTRHEKTADMLIGNALSPDGKTLALVSAGYGKHVLNFVDTATGALKQTVALGKAWNGVAWAANNQTVYAGGGSSGTVHVVAQNAAGVWEARPDLTLVGSAPLPAQAYVAGVAVSADGQMLFAADILHDAIRAVRLSDGTVIKNGSLAKGTRPFSLRVGGPNNALYVSEWGGKRILALDPQTLEVKQAFAVGDHPNDMTFTHDKKRLFVSCGNDDTVSVVDLATGKTTEKIHTAITPNAPPGATPCSVTISPDDKTLYVANADNNAVAVVDISTVNRSRVTGFIPTAWYTTAVAVSPDGKRVFIGSGKGMGTGANPPTRAVLPTDISPKGTPYIATRMAGDIATVPTPDARQLAMYTKQVFANTPYINDAMRANPAEAPKPGENAIPSKVGDASPIKHVLYIIKENRTYDQVFGDLKQGNGDPKLTLFGEQVTPNQHALVQQYVLLDNLYCNGEVSADGHPWSDAAIATDFTQRTWPVSYSKKGDPPANVSVTVPASGYLWDACARKNLSYRSYGEQTFAVSADAPPEALESSDGATSLKGHASQAWQKRRAAARDPEKADIFIKELHEFEKNGKFPNFMVMSLGENHTTGTRVGTFTPKAHVAANDLAVGKIVDAISHSKYWATTAIFIIEDDAQNGPDHVDAHRTCGLVISPYTRRGVVDSTFYTTTSFLRTMELMLGLPPLTQYDAAAIPLYASFTNKADLSAYTMLAARTDMNTKNEKLAYGAKRMQQIDFSDYDHLTGDDEDALNQALWYSIKGTNTPYPTPVRRALVMPTTGQSIVSKHEDEEEEEREESKPRRPRTSGNAHKRSEKRDHDDD